METAIDAAAVARFEEQRRYLFSIAYRMLGSVMDAEDMVQETFVRWQKAQPRDLRSLRAWLATVITRLCINHLNSARVQREEYVGPWLPEPLVEAATDPDLGDSLSLAFLVLLEALTPTERAVFLLREVFDYEFGEIARIVKKTPANCRQILVRAKRHVVERRPRYETSLEKCQPLFERFFQATATGDVSRLMALFDEHATLVADGGGKARALLRPILGADRIARALAGGIRRFAPGERTYRPAIVNNLPGFLVYHDAELTTVFTFGIRRGRIYALHVMRNPDKLRHLQGDRSTREPGGVRRPADFATTGTLQG
ncbi:MAG TPA: RNA polymerase sigma-70 factor [Opitutaceae bacterium]